jgi:3-oxoacyl-[acyl-carrier protein] reductase
MNSNKKIALVTGSSRSLGETIIRSFLEANYEVIINYNNSYEKAKKLKQELEKKYNKEILLIKCDISKEEEIINMRNIIEERYKSIDVLVNNAAICNDTLFEEKTKEDFLKVLETNVVGTYLVTKHITKIMNKGSRIINIASDNGLNNTYPESADYDASKAGVISLTHNMAKYYAPNINVNCICPGWIDTEMNKELTPEQIKEIEKTILLSRFAKKEEIANLVLFLASDKAAYINDSIITINGGIK